MEVKNTKVKFENIKEGDVFEFDDFRSMLLFEKLSYQRAYKEKRNRPIFLNSQERIRKKMFYRLTVVGFKPINTKK